MAVPSVRIRDTAPLITGGNNCVSAVGHFQTRLSLGQCCIKVTYGIFWATLSRLSLAVTKLRRRLSQNSSPKQSHGAIRHKPDPEPRTKLE